MQTAEKVFEPDSGYLLHYKQDITVKKEAGEGKFVLMVRPPRGSTTWLEGGELSHSGEGDYTTSLEVDCTQLNSETDNDYLKSEGSLQLWIQDPLSGSLDHKVSEVALSCVDESKKAVYSLEFGKKVEFADSNNTNLHYTRDLRIKHKGGVKSKYIVELNSPKDITLKFTDTSEKISQK
jgi:hypothetical protein